MQGKIIGKDTKKFILYYYMNFQDITSQNDLFLFQFFCNFVKSILA